MKARRLIIFILASFICLAVASSVSAASCNEDKTTNYLTSLFNPLASFSQKILNDFHIKTALADVTFPGPNGCGNATVLNGQQAVSFSWTPAAYQPSGYSFQYYVVTVNGVGQYTAGAGGNYPASYITVPMPAVTGTYSWSVDASYYGWGMASAGGFMSNLPYGSFNYCAPGCGSCSAPYNGTQTCYYEDCSSYSQSCGSTPPSCAASCGSWDSCSVSCGGGTQSQTCTRADCSTYTQTQSCNTQSCPPSCTASCGSWGSCSAQCGGGTQTQTCTRVDCSTYTQTQSCNTQSCPPTCTASCGSWGGCSVSCGGGTQSQTCTRADCSTYSQTQSCNTQTCPSTCTASCGSWDSCSASCGGGSQSRTCTNTDCSTYSQTQSCNTQSCPPTCTASCNSWDSCSAPCGGGTQSRTCTNTDCSTYSQTQSCNTQTCPSTCTATCNSWGDCSAPCGGGSQSRTCVNSDCSTYNQSQSCNTQTCPSSCTPYCNSWGDCSALCGGGSQSRICVASDCSTYSQNQSCDTQSCSSVCGDGICNGGETCSSCPSDCGNCAAYCGDGSCNNGETCSSCSTDCGVCPPTCTSTCSSGAKQCSGSNVQTCADYNSDSCTEWGGDSYCAYGCSGGSCLAPTLSATLSVSPSIGVGPLNSTLTAQVSGSAAGGSMNYTFYCNRNDHGTNITSPWDAKFDGVYATTETHTCTYNTMGTYYPKVIVESAAPAVTDVKTATVTDTPPIATPVNPATQPNYCSSSPMSTYHWTFSDPDHGDTQSAYEVQTADNSGFNAPLADDSGKVVNSGNSYTTPVGKLQYNKTYYWRVRVWDNHDVASTWTSGNSFSTPSHEYPTIGFSWAPMRPSQGETVLFADQSQVYGGATKINWSWTIQSVGYVSGTNANSANPEVQFTSPGSKSVSLKVCDSSNYCCTKNLSNAVSVSLPLPDWKEIPPK